MTNLDLIDWTIEAAARVRSERAEAANPTDPRRPLDKLLAELESDPAEPVRAATPELRSNIVVDSTENTTLSTARTPREGMRAEGAEPPPPHEIARTELAASAERFAALEKRYSAHLVRQTPAPPESATTPAASSAEENAVVPKPALLMAIVEPTIHTARADRDRAVDLRWILRDIGNQRPRCGVEDDLGVLTEFGLVEMRDGKPVLTSAGLKAIA
jgi:hypothetical protein